MSSAEARSNILGLNNVSFGYGAEPFISGMDLGIGEAEFIALLGANGSGKSTVLQLMAGILKPAGGGVELWSKPIASLSNRDRAKLLSYLPQMLDMNVPFTVSELVGMGLYPYDSPPELSRDEAIAVVGLSDKKDTRIANLSGGERRRAYIAMTLIQGAGVLLLDEPLANLDVRYQVEIIGLLRKLNAERKISIVMALHDINLAFQFDRTILIKQGGVLGSGAPEVLLSEGLLKEAFGIVINIHRFDEGTFIGYGQKGEG